jgi:hypothetical protein
MKKKMKNPCAKCEDNELCTQRNLYRNCYAWRMWFHQQWEEIQQMFDVSERHEEKEGDDN